MTTRAEQHEQDLTDLEANAALPDDWGAPNYTNAELKQALSYLDSQVEILEAQQEHTLNLIYTYWSLAHQLAEAGATAEHGNVKIADDDFTVDE